MFRIDSDLYAAAKAVAAERGETLTRVITEALRRYVKRHERT
jgi:predicted transcriptional regulator